MIRSATPAISLVALACMIAAGASHWWSVRQLVVLMDGGIAVPRAAAAEVAPVAGKTDVAEPAGDATPQIAAADPVMPAGPPVGEPIETQQQFYQELIREMQQLRNQNRDLLNQVAETNRDLMKLEFRVDTHSEQFRPLPVTEDKIGTTFGTSFDESPGLLPPRAEPVVLPFAE
ncbi:MAG: hypothetical protein ACNA8L_12530 [Luteolibacter sp.]|jgi:hypothetical protein